MRHDTRYWRVHRLITAPEIPRMADGEGIRLCKRCQRAIYLRRDFLEMLLFDLRLML